MHAISFQLKRAHLSAVAFGRKAVEKVGGMTPARFDLLCAIRQVGLTGGRLYGRLYHPCAFGMAQNELTRTLGLSRSTVSKMLKRLEELGWVKRQPESDRRVKYVTLTKEGLRRIWRAMRRVFRGRILLRAYEELFADRLKQRHVLARIDDAWLLINAIARHFGDQSTDDYDYGYMVG